MGCEERRQLRLPGSGLSMVLVLLLLLLFGGCGGLVLVIWSILRTQGKSFR